MASGRVTGIAYKLELTDGNVAHRVMKITACSIVSEPDGFGFLNPPKTWRFSVTPPDGFTPHRFGASEVRGMFGGVENAYQQAHSEACERAIGDVLTVMMCDLLDGEDTIAKVESTVLVFGPAFPKVVGRFASLRIPHKVTVAWLCPVPFPKWIAQGVNEVQLFPMSTPASHEPSHEGWEDEALIQSSLFHKRDQRENWWIQLFTQEPSDRLSGSTNVLAVLDKAKWFQEQFTGVLVPREFAIAIDQVQIQATDPYKWIAGTSIRHSSKELPEIEVMSDQRSLRIGSGWPFRWID